MKKSSSGKKYSVSASTNYALKKLNDYLESNLEGGGRLKSLGAALALALSTAETPQVQDPNVYLIQNYLSNANAMDFTYVPHMYRGPDVLSFSDVSHTDIYNKLPLNVPLHSFTYDDVPFISVGPSEKEQNAIAQYAATKGRSIFGELNNFLRHKKYRKMYSSKFLKENILNLASYMFKNRLEKNIIVYRGNQREYIAGTVEDPS